MQFQISTYWLFLPACLLFLLTACDAASNQPDVASLRGPVDGEVFDTDSLIQLRWDPSRDAASYIVQVATDDGFTPPLADEDRVAITRADVGPLAKGTYFWRVISLGVGQDKGPASPSNWFIVEDQRSLACNNLIWGFTFDISGGANGTLEVTGPDSLGFNNCFIHNLHLPTADVRTITPQTVTITVEEPDGTTLQQVGTFSFLLTTSSDEKVEVARLTSPPASSLSDMTLIVDAVSPTEYPVGVLRITPAESLPAGTYRVSVKMEAAVLAVVP
ncbi:MAG TPA: hypothetical protein VFG50_03845 [Rhodothermales bacterium]|nr:hypothetical protein [Rhodothermales bacterium]